MARPILFSAKPLFAESALAIVRISIGLLMAYHGLEVFQPDIMAGYQTWDVIKKMPSPAFMVYLGKGLELVTGICFIVGIFTRLAALAMAIDLLFICFVIGKGRFYYEDQHPFLFAMLAIIYFFTGPVKWSIDQRIFK